MRISDLSSDVCSSDLVRIPDLVAKVLEYGQPAVALTDLSNVFGLVKFYKAARKAGVKPLAGCDVYVQNDEDRDKPHRVMMLVAGAQGYLNLCRLLTQAWLDNQYRGRAEDRKRTRLKSSHSCESRMLPSA